MIWVVFIVVALAVVGLFAGLLAGRIDYDPLSDPTASQPDTGLPDEPSAEDVTGVRFDTALRGYRMDQVDDVLDRLQERLQERETELAERDRELAMFRGSGTTHDVGRELRREPGPEPGPGVEHEPGREPGRDVEHEPGSGSDAGPRPAPGSGSGRPAVRGPQR